MRFSTASLLCTFLVPGSSPAFAEFLRVDQEVDNNKPIASEVQLRGLEDPVICGSLQCQNGGKCGGIHDYLTGIDEVLCDCSAAFDASSNMKFVGKTCEIQVKEEDYCKGKTSLDLFCVNGGVCRRAAADYETKPCNCASDYTGLYCEYLVQEVQEECSLSCGDGGACYHGFSPYGDSGANVILSSLSESENLTQNFMYCACNSGFVGPKCEFSYIKCGGRHGYCFHGAKCAPEDSADLCDCTDSGNETKTAQGEHCQYVATDKCNHPIIIDDVTSYQDFTDERKMNVSDGDYPFCVNDGVCYELNKTEVYYCYCEPGYRGSRCELRFSTPAPNSSPAPSQAVTESALPTISSSYTDKPFSRPTVAPVAKPTVAPHHSETAAPHLAKPPSPQNRPTWPPTRAPIDSTSVSAASNAEEEPNGGLVLGISLAVLLSLLSLVVVVAYFNNRSEFVNSMVYQENAEDNIPPAHNVNVSLPAEEDLTTDMRSTSTAAMAAAEDIGEPSAKEII